MTDIEEKLALPEPLKVKPSIQKYLDKLEDDGKTIWAFQGKDIIENLFYLYLTNKYKSKCIPKGRRYARIGLQIPLKLKYSKEDEVYLDSQFNEISEIIAGCVKRGEKMILIPLSYNRSSGGHYNLLIYKVENNEIEHFEPHGGEYSGDQMLQSAAKKVLIYFVKILNMYLKHYGLHETEYVEASQVCPYIQGLQYIEYTSKLPKKSKLEPSGYCAAWGLFFAELNLKNPNLKSAEILDNIYNYLTTKESGPDYLKRVIRGYSGYIYQTVDRYLEIFFKPRVRLVDLIVKKKSDNLSNFIINEAIKVLIDLERIIITDSTFDLKKELKTIMKEYKKQTQGMNKEQQRVMRNKLENINLRHLYYKKRILQNYEEYKREGYISDPVFDSPQDIKNEDIKNLRIIEKGILHELVAKEKKTSQTKTKTKTKGKKSSQNSKTVKMRSPKDMEEIIK